ncbi:MAG TPA: transcriptional repressor LexA [Oligoflexia bacterium]|nr:transcriptional repressor LexA [Oligoflexia bacterium]
MSEPPGCSAQKIAPGEFKTMVNKAMQQRQKKKAGPSVDTEDFSFKSHTLAPVQRQTLEYLRTFIAERGYGPTLKDIANFIGVRSPSTAHFHLSRLEDKGFIKRGDDGSIELADLEELQSNAGPCAVPLLGLIAAGSPIEAIEDTTVTVDIPPQFLIRSKEIFCLQVTGDSMIDAHILDGDIIIVAKQDSADNGQIVVALLEDNTATVKTFRRLKGGKVMLIPHNPAHQPITVERVQIQGRVIGLVREMQI